MLAQKDSVIWRLLGDSSIFQDGLDHDVPPFARDSGYGWSAVSRTEAEFFGVITKDEHLPVDPDEQRHLKEISKKLDPVLLRAAIADLTKQIKEHTRNLRANGIERTNRISAWLDRYRCFYFNGAEVLGPVSLWIVHEMIETDDLPSDVQTILEGEDSWKPYLEQEVRIRNIARETK